jgi:hypothetical protein
MYYLVDLLMLHSKLFLSLVDRLAFRTNMASMLFTVREGRFFTSDEHNAL